ncbi:hypothetical protein TNCV_3272771 [Trichonephila clavipes]|nr:hypothetical protein TNCV_3272771 [Trichonephila clavipes]
MCLSKGGNQRKASLPSANNFMVTHPGQTVIDKTIGERLSIAYFRAATVGNAVKGFKKNVRLRLIILFCLANMTLLLQKKIAPDVVGDETENNTANPQTLVEENQHKVIQKDQNL